MLDELLGLLFAFGDDLLQTAALHVLEHHIEPLLVAEDSVQFYDMRVLVFHLCFYVVDEFRLELM